MRVERSLGTVLKAMILAGLIAGGALAVFHSMLTEPVIDQAIELEQARADHDGEGVPVVSRETQKSGLVVGSLLYGLFVGIIFGGVFYLVQAALPTHRVLTSSALLALAAYWLIGLFPFLKYPANPPGVGQPETIEYRQSLFLAFLLLSVLGGLAAGYAFLRSGRRWSVAAVYGVFALVLYVLMPANPDPIEMPMGVVTSFRALSILGLSAFWLVLGVSFGLLAERLQPDTGATAFEPKPA